jgi:hypothetical protein
VSTTKTHTIASLRTQITQLDIQIKETEKADMPDEMRLADAEKAWGEACDALLMMKPNTDAEILALAATLQERTLSPCYDQWRDKLDERDQGMVHLTDAVMQRLAA